MCLTIQYRVCKIAQAAFAFLHIRLDQIAGIALPRMAIVTLFELVRDELRVLPLDRLFELKSSRVCPRPSSRIAKQEARIEQAGLDCDILLGQTHAFLRRPERVADF